MQPAHPPPPPHYRLRRYAIFGQGHSHRTHASSSVIYEQSDGSERREKEKEEEEEEGLLCFQTKHFPPPRLYCVHRRHCMLLWAARSGSSGSLLHCYAELGSRMEKWWMKYESCAA
jgi:hypothetical protein